MKDKAYSTINIIAKRKARFKITRIASSAISEKHIVHVIGDGEQIFAGVISRVTGSRGSWHVDKDAHGNESGWRYGTHCIDRADALCTLMLVNELRGIMNRAALPLVA